ncbi:MAG: hypothetical protein ABUL72_05415, partial [Armatimonadota bacterium]
MNWRTIRLVVGLAVILLALSAVLALSSKDDVKSFPTIEGRTPSGLLAFAENLRQDGYQVVMDRSTRPKLQKGDVPVVIDLTDDPAIKKVLGVDPETNTSEWQDKGSLVKFKEAITDYVAKGETGLVLNISTEFQDATTAATVTKVQMEGSAKTLDVTDSHPTEGTFHETGKNSSFTLWSKLPTDTQKKEKEVGPGAVELSTLKAGRFVTVTDAIGFTNRFITQDDNAAYALAVIRSTIDHGHRLVFLENSFGNTKDRGLLDSAGEWAVTAMQQFVLLVLVIVFTVAVRFGSPRTPRIEEKGVRSMVDAMGANLGRLRHPSFALTLFLDDVYERVRLALRAPVGTKRN